MKSIFSMKVWFFLIAIAFLPSCVSTPKRSPVEKLGQAEADTPKLSELVSSYDERKRNAWIELNVIRINEDFDELKASLQRLRTGSGISSATIALLSNYLSGLTNSPGVKANYVALNGIATGFNEIAFKENFMEQTVATLISAMEGRRAEAYKRVRIGMAKSVGEYNLADAHKDVLAYSWAGRLESGMSFAAKATEQASQVATVTADQEIASIVSYTEEERQLAYCVSESLDSLNSSHVTALKNVIAGLGIGSPADDQMGTLVEFISKARVNSPPKFQRAVSSSMQANNLLLNPCPRY